MRFLDETGLSYFWNKVKALLKTVAFTGSYSDLTDTPTNHVTTDTDQNITGTKTFVGQKRIKFKQSGSSDKLGFTLFTNNDIEKGYLEYNPTGINGIPLMTLGNYATASNGLTYVGFRRYSNISGASGAYNLITPLISDAKTPFNLTTTYTNFYLMLGATDGTTTVTVDNTGMLDLSSLLPTIPTNISSFTNDSGYLTSVDWSNILNKPTLATVATTGSYNDLTDKPDLSNITAEQEVAYTSSDPTSASVAFYADDSIILQFDSEASAVGTPVYTTGEQIITGTKTFNDTIRSSKNVTMVRDIDTDAFRIYGGSSEAAGGGQLFLYGKNHASNPGFFQITAINTSDGSKALIGKPDGTLTWSNKDIITNGGDQTVGGTKTFNAGIIAATGDILQRNGDTSWIRINGGTTYTNGASLLLYGKDATQNPSKFSLQAHDGITGSTLTGSPDGILTWTGKSFVYDSGNQTISGQKTFSSTIFTNNNIALAQKSNTTELDIYGGTTSTDGASIYLYGAGHSNVGMFRIRAANSSYKDLIGGTDGILKWDGKGFVYDSGDQTIAGTKTIQTPIITDTATTETGMHPSDASHGLSFYGGTTSRNGSILVLYSQGRTEYPGQFRLRASTTSAMKDMIGTPTGGLTWGGQNIQVGSDRRIKTAIGHFPDAVLEAWGNISWEQYKYTEDAERKGEENCRFHAGLIAQDVQQACEEQGQDILKYGILCHEEWQDEYETKEDGTRKLVRPAGELWTVRYTEALCMEAAYQRRRADKAEARITALEQRLGELEAVLANLISSN